jgi:pectin methylesterase-like acyl-CoA thioesterase
MVTSIITVSTAQTTNNINRGGGKHVYYVSPQGDNGNNGESMEKPFKTLKKAVEKCDSGDEIKIMNGEYTETPITITKDILITGLDKNKNNIKTELNTQSSVTIQNCSFSSAELDEIKKLIQELFVGLYVIQGI